MAPGGVLTWRVAQTLVCMSAPRLEERVAQRGEAATKKDPSPYHPFPLFPLPRGEGRGGGELG
jgi:hypothetical protein